MKKFERFISLLLTLMMLFTGVVPAAAEPISDEIFMVRTRSFTKTGWD